MAGLSYAELSFEQSGNDTLIKKGTETLNIIQNITLDNINYYDIVSTSTDAQTLSGTPEDDILLGGSGNDTFTTGSATDVVLGYGGNDSITINNGGNITVNGGSGTDTLSISYSGITDIGSFVTRIRQTDNVYVLTDGSGNTISFINIGSDIDGDVWGATTGLTINGANYCISSDKYSSLDLWYPNSSSAGAVIYSLSTGKVGLVANADTNRASFVPSRTGGSPCDADSLSTTAMTIYGTAIPDHIEGSSEADTIYGYADNDLIHSLAGADNIYAGDGDDLVFVKVANLTNYSVLDGGAGSDTLNFGLPESSMGGNFLTEAAITIDLSGSSKGKAANFENIVGSRYNDTITGDSSANILIGSAGNDTINGGEGNDIIYGEASSGGTYANQKAHLISDYSLGSMDTNDVLNGGAGDDTIYGDLGQDTIDGGAGADTLTGGAGIDTFVIREGEGGSSISDADRITDFTDGSDKIGMSGLNYSDLTIEQGTGSYSSHVVVKKTSSGEFLTIIQNISLSSVDDYDFSAI
jgi:Ca2+-binding RTX toxin-like protein